MSNLVKHFRLKVGLSQVEVSRRAKIAVPNLSAIENNRREAWPLARMRLAKALKCPEGTLFPKQVTLIKEEPVEVEKVWGYELWLVNRPEYCGKLLFVDKNAESSSHCHRLKTETFKCLEGAALLTVDGTEYVLSPVSRAKTIMPGSYHSFKAIIKTTILEVSTHHDEDDVYRKTESKPGIRRKPRLSHAHPFGTAKSQLAAKLV